MYKKNRLKKSSPRWRRNLPRRFSRSPPSPLGHSYCPTGYSLVPSSVLPSHGHGVNPNRHQTHELRFFPLPLVRFFPPFSVSFYLLLRCLKFCFYLCPCDLLQGPGHWVSWWETVAGKNRLSAAYQMGCRRSLRWDSIASCRFLIRFRTLLRLVSFFQKKLRCSELVVQMWIGWVLP